jgi:hypothetical protein
MKLFNLVLLLVVVAGSNVQAQDYFIVKSGDTTFCDIIYTTPFKFGYLKSGRVEHVNKNEVLEVYRAEDSTGEEDTVSNQTLSEKYPDLALRNTRITPASNSNTRAEKAINFAGRQLEKSRTLFYIGLACQVVGGGIMALSALPTNNNPNTTLIIGGSVAGVGSIVSITAFIPIGRAGIELQKVRLQ